MSILDKLPSLEIKQEDVKAVNNINKDDKKFILCLTRDIEQQELELLKSYGKVFEFHESFRNIPLSSHIFEYAIFDLRQKIHRDALMKEDLSQYHIVCIVGLLDKHDDTHRDIKAENLVHSFPSKQAFKSDFDTLLLSAKIRKPSIIKSVLRFLCSLSSGYMTEQ